MNRREFVKEFDYDKAKTLEAAREEFREEAEKLVEDEFCGEICDRPGCNWQDTCDGYKEEVERAMKEMAEELPICNICGEEMLEEHKNCGK